MSTETIKAIIENEENASELLSEMVRFHIREAYLGVIKANLQENDEEVKKKTGSLLSEAQIEEIQQLFLDEGIGRSLKRFAGFWITAGWTASVVGGLINAGAMAASALGLISMGTLGLTVAANAFVLSPIAGIAAGVYGYRAVRGSQKTVSSEIAGKLGKITHQRDELLKQIEQKAKEGIEDTSNINKIDRLTADQQKLGRALKDAARKDAQSKEHTDRAKTFDFKEFERIADVAIQGKLTLIEVK